jgi:hypothetical protein
MMIQGNITGTDIYRNLHQYKKAQRVHLFLILTVEAVKGKKETSSTWKKGWSQAVEQVAMKHFH